LPASDQGVTFDRYMLIPRTAIFVRREERYLLLKGAPGKRLWAGKYNGLGGHVEQGESILEAARRELREETGLEVDLWCCGTLVVDTGKNPGVCLFIYTGKWQGGEPVPTREGQARWVDPHELGKLPVVDDLPVLLQRIHQLQPGDLPFSARSHYDKHGKIVVEFNS
jgi:8-oxo-dGTP diphosphatase